MTEEVKKALTTATKIVRLKAGKLTSDIHLLNLYNRRPVRYRSTDATNVVEGRRRDLARQQKQFYNTQMNLTLQSGGATVIRFIEKLGLRKLYSQPFEACWESGSRRTRAATCSSGQKPRNN